MNTKIFALTLFFVLGAGAKLGYSQRIDLSGVTSIEVNIACQLILVQGNEPNFEIVGDERAIAAIRTVLKGGKLTIRSDRKRQRKEEVVVKIEVQDLQHLAISGAVDMKTIRQLSFSNFNLTVSGVGNIDMDIACNSFNLVSSGVSNLNISGSANNMKIVNSGSGNINAKEFKTANAKISNSGVGRVKVNVTETLNASLSGVGSISYVGNPMVSSRISGIGRIVRI